MQLEDYSKDMVVTWRNPISRERGVGKVSGISIDTLNGTKVVRVTDLETGNKFNVVDGFDGYTKFLIMPFWLQKFDEVRWIGASDRVGVVMDVVYLSNRVQVRIRWEDPNGILETKHKSYSVVYEKLLKNIVFEE